MPKDFMNFLITLAILIAGAGLAYAAGLCTFIFAAESKSLQGTEGFGAIVTALIIMIAAMSVANKFQYNGG